VRASRGPWWLYTIAALFLYSLTLHIYNVLWGACLPEKPRSL
jgi:hypothetical protein